MSDAILALIVTDDCDGMNVEIASHSHTPELALAIANARLGLRTLTGRIDEQLGTDGAFGLAVQNAFLSGINDPTATERTIIREGDGDREK